MRYPKQFVERVKTAYPDFDKLHQALDAGSEWVGRYLDDSAPTGMPLKTILEAKSLDSLQAQAQMMQEKVNLYSEWGQMYRAQNQINNRGR